MRKISYTLASALIVFSFLCVTGYSHAGNLVIMLNIKDDALTNDTPNNYIIGNGIIKNNQSDMVLISSDAEKVTGTQSTYIFRGKNNPANKIKIRLGGDNWIADANDLGIVTNTKTTNNFNLYYVKDGIIVPDTYIISLYAEEINHK